MEKLGTGIVKMRRWMKEYGLKPPRIEADGFFTIIFGRSQKAEKDIHKMSIKNVGKTERKKIILEKIRGKDFSSLRVAAKELGVTIKTIYRDIEEFKISGKIKFVGPKRGGHYEVR